MHDRPAWVVLGGRNSTGTRDFPETHAGVSTITVTLRDRRVFTEVEVAWATEVIRVLGHATIPFTADEIADVDDTPPGWSDAEEVPFHFMRPGVVTPADAGRVRLLRR